jgi:hypothetical protein
VHTIQCKDDEEKAEDGRHELHGYEAAPGAEADGYSYGEMVVAVNEPIAIFIEDFFGR